MKNLNHNPVVFLADAHSDSLFGESYRYEQRSDVPQDDIVFEDDDMDLDEEEEDSLVTENAGDRELLGLWYPEVGLPDCDKIGNEI